MHSLSLEEFIVFGMPCKKLNFKNASYMRVVVYGMTLGKILFMNLELKIFLVFIFIMVLHKCWIYKKLNLSIKCLLIYIFGIHERKCLIIYSYKFLDFYLKIHKIEGKWSISDISKKSDDSKELSYRGLTDIWLVTLFNYGTTEKI